MTKSWNDNENAPEPTRSASQSAADTVFAMRDASEALVVALAASRGVDDEELSAELGWLLSQLDTIARRRLGATIDAASTL